jgi:hypothetical protein
VTRVPDVLSRVTEPDELLSKLYGERCNAHFWPQPHELSCDLAPGHEGDHRAGGSERAQTDTSQAWTPGYVPVAERLDLLDWIASRHDVLRLVRALRNAGYDESATEYLRRIVERDRT